MADLLSRDVSLAENRDDAP